MNLFDFIFPKRCLECNKLGSYICQSCLEKVPSGGLFNGNYAIFRYKGVIRRAIITLKYKFASDITKELVNVCVARLIKNNFKVNSKYNKIVLVPIPLYKTRFNWRGFNQSEVVGEKIAKLLNWKYSNNLLIRNKQTIPQVQLKGVDRRKSLSGVFMVNTQVKMDNGNLIIIFDDVYTTGSTLGEVIKVLKINGYPNTTGLTICK